MRSFTALAIVAVASFLLLEISAYQFKRKGSAKKASKKPFVSRGKAAAKKSEEDDNGEMATNEGELVTRETKPMFTNIGYLMMGYDVLEGNPMSTERFDGGFKNSIFETSYEGERETDDRRYTIPDGLEINEFKTCKLAFSSTTIMSKKEYQDSLGTTASVSASGGIGLAKASFTASTDYKQMSKKISTNNNALVKSEAVCTVYKASIQDQTPPKLKENFFQFVERLAGGANEYGRFVDEFGTHFIKRASMGARYTEIREISKEKREELSTKGVDVNLAASVSSLGKEGSVELGVSTSTSDLEEFENDVESKTVISVGSQPPASGKVEDWVVASTGSPLPTYYELSSILLVFHAAYFKDHPDIDYEKVSTGLTAYLKSYCQTKKNNGFPDTECEGPPTNCAGGSRCSANGNCINQGESYGCECKSGFIGNGEVCRKDPKWQATVTLQHPSGERGVWGNWGQTEHCQDGVFAKGFLMRNDPNHGGGLFYDNTASNAVCLLCGQSSRTCSTIGPWGKWSSTDIKCEEGCFLAGWKQRVLGKQGIHDDTMLNDVEYECRKLDDWSECGLLKGGGVDYGRWSRMLRCPKGEFICGINTRIAPHGGDDTALNDIKHACCKPL